MDKNRNGLGQRLALGLGMIVLAFILVVVFGVVSDKPINYPVAFIIAGFFFGIPGLICVGAVVVDGIRIVWNKIVHNR